MSDALRCRFENLLLTSAALLAASAHADPGTLRVAPTQGTFALPDSPTLLGQADAHISDIRISNGAGSLVVDGVPLTAFIQARVPWASEDLTLYEALALDSSHWDVFWIYCRGGSLIDVYFEGVDGPSITQESASGSCADNPASASVPVTLPAVSLAEPKPIRGFSIQGADISLTSGSTGTLRNPDPAAPAADREFQFVPFSVVDCRYCGGAGWYELHSIFWNETEGRACFGVVYLDLPRGPSTVKVAYSFCLPDLAVPFETLQLPAAWSGN